MTDDARAQLRARLLEKSNQCRRCHRTGRVDRREWQEGTREWEYVGGTDPCPDCGLMREAASLLVDPAGVTVSAVADAMRERLQAIEAAADEHGATLAEAAQECSGTGEKTLERAYMAGMNAVNATINEIRALRCELDAGVTPSEAEQRLADVNVKDRVKTREINILTQENRELLQRLAVLEVFARDCAENYDHDKDAHRYNTHCRVCEAEKSPARPVLSRRQGAAMRELHYGNYDAATTELLVELDRLYPLPNDATRAERAAATSAAVTRWMTRATADIERMIPELIASVRFRGSNER